MTQKINIQRLLKKIEALSGCGRTEEGAVTRLALSLEDKAARDLVVSWMQGLGLDIKVDQIGNIFGTRAGSKDGAPVMTGSHIDTVIGGGTLDGAYGVLAGLEAIEVLNEAGVETEKPVCVAVFTNEEGTRFHRWLIGSRAMAGLLEPEDLAAIDDEGVSLEARMADIGGDLSCVAEAARKPGDLAAYFELHIEQGPALHQAGIPIGVVTGITGRATFDVEITGVANHAGTTPMGSRRDALVSASRLVLAVNKLMLRSLAAFINCGYSNSSVTTLASAGVSL